ncbi:MAG: hypothetical protein JXR37_00010 [Kiritimatiellae bacterium]|nr:hypothetical protein [Kiritimatiellia bacterium]
MAQPAMGPLAPHPANTLWFRNTATGEPVYLTGSHAHHVLHDQGAEYPPPPFDYDGFIALLRAHGHNFLRLWAWEHSRWACWLKTDDFWYHPLPYARVPGHGTALDGLPKFDLTRYDEEFFQRLRRRVELARANGIYVAVMLFEGCSVEFKRPVYKRPWDGHPYNTHNNINGIDGDTNGDGLGYDFHQWPLAPGVWALQQAYIRKIIDTLNDLDNVLYEVGNECHPDSLRWQYEVIRTIQQYESTRKPNRHPVGITAVFPHEKGTFQGLLDSPADWVAPAYTYWDTDNPPIPAAGKVVIADTDHFQGAQGDRKLVWKAFLRGNHPIVLDNPDRADPDHAATRRAMGQTLACARKLDLAKMTPSDKPEDCSSTFLLYEPGRQYIAYQPAGNAMTITLDAGTYACDYIDPQTGNVTSGRIQQRTPGPVTLPPPYDADWAVCLKQGRDT